MFDRDFRPQLEMGYIDLEENEAVPRPLFPAPSQVDIRDRTGHLATFAPIGWLPAVLWDSGRSSRCVFWPVAMWRGRHYGTQFWINPTNRVVSPVMTQTAIMGS